MVPCNIDCDDFIEYARRRGPEISMLTHAVFCQIAETGNLELVRIMLLCVFTVLYATFCFSYDFLSVRKIENLPEIVFMMCA